MTNEDAAGTTALMDKMSEREYEQVRSGSSTAAATPRRTASTATASCRPSRRGTLGSTARGAEVPGPVSYEVMRDREPGQIKAKIAGTGMEIRLTDTSQEEYAGARIYDNGSVLRYSTNYRVPGGMAVYSPSPADAVQLLALRPGPPRRAHGIRRGHAGRRDHTTTRSAAADGRSWTCRTATTWTASRCSRWPTTSPPARPDRSPAPRSCCAATPRTARCRPSSSMPSRRRPTCRTRSRAHGRTCAPRWTSTR